MVSGLQLDANSKIEGRFYVVMEALAVNVHMLVSTYLGKHSSSPSKAIL